MDGAFAGSTPYNLADSYMRSGLHQSDSVDGSGMPLMNPEIPRAAGTQSGHQEVEAHLSFPIRLFFGDPQNLS